MRDFFEPIYEVFIHLVGPQNGNCYPTIIPVNYPLSLCLHSVNIGYKTTSHFSFYIKWACIWYLLLFKVSLVDKQATL